MVFDLGSLYAYLQSVPDKRKPRGLRSQLVTLLVLIVGEAVYVEELEQASSLFLSEKKYFGRQVLVSIDGKVVCGTLDEFQTGAAFYFPQNR